MECEKFEIDTKGLCILCLRDCSRTVGGENSEEKDGDSKTFKLLLRYLKVNILNFQNFSSSFLHSLDGFENLDVMIAMCAECSSLAKTFSQLYQDFESIRLQMDCCIQSIHDLISCGDKERIVEFGRRLTSRNPLQLFNASIAETLRKETIQKCAVRIKAMAPRVALRREQDKLKSFEKLATNPKPIMGVKRLPGPKQSKKNACISASPASSHKNHTAHSHLEKHLNTIATLPAEPETVDNEDSSSLNCMELVECEVSIKVQETETFDTDDCLQDNLNMGDSFDTESNEADVSSSSPQLQFKTNVVNSEIAVLKNHSCSYCTKTFPSRQGLFGHMHVHTKLKSTNKNSVVSYQQKTSASGRKFANPTFNQNQRCNVCGKCFSSRHSLQLHLRVHTGERPFKCSYCKSNFTQYSCLRTHMIGIHSMEVFAKYLPVGTTKEELDSSIQSILEKQIQFSNSKPYGCPHCLERRAFESPSKLRVHVLRTHFDKLLMNLQNQLSRDGSRGIHELDGSSLSSLHGIFEGGAVETGLQSLEDFMVGVGTNFPGYQNVQKPSPSTIDPLSM